MIARPAPAHDVRAPRHPVVPQKISLVPTGLSMRSGWKNADLRHALFYEGERMRCLFCKADSSQSRSVEHIIPESLGNTRHVLGKGVVCDGCNNYFAKAVEKPFLEAPGVKILRFEQELLSKKGRVPPHRGPDHTGRARGSDPLPEARTDLSGRPA